MSYDVDAVKDAASQLWLSVITSTCNINPEQLNGRKQDCPKCGGSGSNDRFRVFPDFSETGGVVCNQCGKKADGIATIQWLNDCSFSDALNAVGNLLNVSAARRPPRRTAKQKPNTRKNKTTKTRRRSSNADLFKARTWNPIVAEQFARKSEQFPSLEVLQSLGAEMGTYLSTVVIAIPIRGESNTEIVGYTIYPAMVAGIPYRKETLSKTTVML